jgi:hypothetical protein
MATEQVLQVPIRRYTIESERPFANVLDGIFGGISRPDTGALFSELEASTSYEQFSSLVQQAQGSAGLMRFWQLGLDGAGPRRTGGTAPGRRPQCASRSSRSSSAGWPRKWETAKARWSSRSSTAAPRLTSSAASRSVTARTAAPSTPTRETRTPLGSGYERINPVMRHHPVVPAGAPGELRLDAKQSDVIPEFPY